MKNRFIRLLTSLLILILSLFFTTCPSPEPEIVYSLGDNGLPDNYYDTIISFQSIAMAIHSPHFDWQSNGMVTSPKQQGSICGSCWAFAAAAVFESKLLINKIGNFDLSEQQQISCNSEMYGCDGGTMLALKYWFDNGPVEEDCAPYQEINTNCSTLDKCNRLPLRLTNYYTVATNSLNDMKYSIWRDGPAYLIFTFYSDFQKYWDTATENTVYKQSDGIASGYHAVTLIGWDDIKEAWLCKNSWGNTGPNKDGTFWMAYEGHKNNLYFGLCNAQLASSSTVISILINGNSTINESSTNTYSCTAYYSDSSSVLVTPAWSVDSPYVSIDSNGSITTSSVNSDQTFILTATYNGIIDRMSIAIKDIALANPTSLLISGNSSINEDSTSSYSCVAYYSDGSNETITPTWSEDSPYATVDSNGIVTTGVVNSNQTFILSASFNNKSDSRSIIIVDSIPAAYPIYRYKKESINRHILSFGDGPTLVGYTLDSDGAEFYIYCNYFVGVEPLYTDGEGLYTTNINEPHNSTFGYVYTGPVSNTVPIYRFRNQSTGDRYFTIYQIPLTITLSSDPNTGWNRENDGNPVFWVRTAE